MPMDWLNTPLDADIGELIARKKRGKAIDTLRRQLQGRLAPPVAVRLQLADLLMQAGRVDEAVPVLLGLADEFATDGFVAKAVAIVKRVDRVQPGRPDIAERLQKLVHQQRRAAVLPSRPRAAVPELGIEEFGADEALAEVELETEVEAEVETEVEAEVQADVETEIEAAIEPILDAVEAVPDEPVLEIAAGDVAPVEIPPTEVAPVEAPPVDIAPAAVVPAPPETVAPDGDAIESLVPETSPETAAIPVEGGSSPPDLPAVDSADAPPAPPTAPGVGKRIRRALWRFLASLPGAEDGDVPPSVLTEELPASAEPGIAPSAVPEGEAPFAPPPPAAVDPSALAPAGAPAPEAETPGASMSEEAFRHQLLDIVEDVLHRPPAPEADPARDALPVMERARVLDLARRMVASRLFKDLSDEELLAIVRGLALRTYEAGDIVVTEGEPGQSLFTLTSGRVKVFVTNPDRRNFEVASLGEGDFFGEISSLSGRPRTATVVAATTCELLELDRPTLDSIARTHERVRDVLESSYIARASSPEAAAVRAVPLPASGTRRKAIEVLEAHFGESRWDPRMRLRLADVLLKAGKDEDAIPILVGLADELAREGYPDKAVAILKKIEQVQRRNVEVVNLAPLLRADPAPLLATVLTEALPAGPPAAGRTTPARAGNDDRFHGWLVDLVRDAVGKLQPESANAPLADAARVDAYGPGLRASPLFEGFTEEELLAVIHGLKLLSFEAGDVIITEGEPGQSVFILTTGRVKVWGRGPDHRSVPLGTLVEGSFFGEISTLSGRPRTATITAAAPCDILELDRAALDAITASHPRVRVVLETFSAARSAHREAARAGGDPISS